jgi:hypothetical protein
MARTICKFLGALFILVGLVGFAAPGLGGFHLSTTHNLIHLISGAAALYLGLKGSLASARLFCIVFGIVYLLLGAAGYLAGADRQHTVAGVTHTGTDSNLLQVLPGSLELASMDHGLHILLGIIFLIGGFLTKADVERAVD